MLAAHLQVAVEAARAAGDLIRRALGRIDGYDTKSGPSDLVTEVDRASEDLIRRRLREAFPDIPVVGEEWAFGRDLDEELRRGPELWLVDPLDGTANFVHGLAASAVSIALVRDGEPVVGVVYDPYRDELFTARAGEGAWLGERRLRVGPCGRLADAMLATGFPSQSPYRQAAVDGVRALVPAIRNLRNFGSAATHLAYVAAGRLSGFWEVNLSPWDMAAGALLVREAGGRVTDTLGRPYTAATRHIVATCGPIHDAVLRLLRDAGATGYGS